MRRYIPFVILGSALVLLVAAVWTAGLNYADDSVPIGQQPIDAGYRTARVCVDDASTQGPIPGRRRAGRAGHGPHGLWLGWHYPSRGAGGHGTGQ